MRNIFLALAILYLFVLAACTTETITPQPTNGKRGSLARFNITGNTLYIVDDKNLHVYNITNGREPVKAGQFVTGNWIETIFSHNAQTLFIGSQSAVHIYDIKNPLTPLLLSTYRHVRACDPVVADNQYAYATLRSGRCGSVNQLHIIDISDLAKPTNKKVYNMVNPHGLGIDAKNKILFVCDQGLKAFSVTDPLDIQLLGKLDIKATDVISYKEKLVVTGKDGIYQFSFKDSTFSQLSKIGITE